MKVFLIAGEVSGDIHGYNLVTELKKLYPNLTLLGTGGSKLKSLNQKQYFTDTDMAIIGFDAVIKKLPFIFRLWNILISLRLLEGRTVIRCGWVEDQDEQQMRLSLLPCIDGENATRHYSANQG